MILRLPIRVTLFDATGNVVKSTNSTKKSQIRLTVHAVPKGLWQFGTCRVWYNKPNDFWNEFLFTSVAQLDAGLLTVTEKPLVDFLKEEIPNQYLEKRKLSPAQQAAIARARNKSSMGAKA